MDAEQYEGMCLPATPVSIPVTTTSQNVETRSVRLMGYSFKESTGAATAQIAILDGGSVAGSPVVFIDLIANESTRDWFGPGGILIKSGLFLQVIAGSVTGVIWEVDQ